MTRSWLGQLSSHSIFDLPSTISHSKGTSELPRPSSPQLSQRFPSHDPHALNNAPQRNTTGMGSYSASMTARPRRERAGGRRNRIVLARGVDLIVAVGRELRLSSLADLKGSYEDEDSDDDHDGHPSTYKILHASAITFEIRQLVLNPTSKLLAVLGHSEVAIVVLPRKGWSSIAGATIECKFYHALPASSAVVQAQFHEWGENGASLLVLTEDGLLREYAVGEDAEEPAQVVDLCDQGRTRAEEQGRSGARKVYGLGNSSRSSPRTAGSLMGKVGFSADDVDASKAASFCFGAGKGDWGCLTLYGLMKNGDVVAVCPFLPKVSTIPASYIRSLAHFVSIKVDYLANINVASSSTSTSTPSTSAPSDFALLYAQQMKYVNQLVRQIAAPPSSRRDRLRTADNEDFADEDIDGEDDDEDLDRHVRIMAPAMFQGRQSRSKRQGPFLLQPAPVELDTAAESYACDIVYISYTSTGVGKEVVASDGSMALGIFVISYSDGKVDLCLEVEKIEARWTGSGRAGVSAMVPSADDLDLPMMAVYETIDLGLASSIPEAKVEEILATNWTTIVRDPLYTDTIYVYHSLGGHCLLLSKWLESVSLAMMSIEDAEEEEEEEKLQLEVERELRSQEGTEVLWILKTISLDDCEASPRVEGISIINDIYLGYSILLVTESLQLVAIELSLRVDSSLMVPSASLIDPSAAAANIRSQKQRGIDTDPPAYLSLLDSPFVVAPLLDPRRSGVSSVPRLAFNPPPSSSAKGKGKSAELTITPESLRFIGKTVETFRHEIRNLVDAADGVQCRLELQMKELSRQLSKLDQLGRMSNDLRQSIGAGGGIGGSGVGGVGLGANGESLSERLSRVTSSQATLLQRTDRLLQRLINAHQPLLSTYEKKWFEELDRLDKEVLTGGERSLIRRVESVEAKVEALSPALREMKEKEREEEQRAKNGRSRASGAGSSLGVSQMTKLEGMLSDEARLIVDARRKLERVTSLLAAM